jgi:hypothetical protein
MGLMQGAPASCRPRRGTAHKHAAACGQAAQQRHKRAPERTGAACPGPAPVHPLTRADEVSAGRLRVPDLTPSTRQESEVGNTTALLQPKDKRDDLSGNALGENPEPPRPRKITARFQVFPQTPFPASPKSNAGPRRTHDRGKGAAGEPRSARPTHTAPCLPDVEALQAPGQPGRRLRKLLDNPSYRGTTAFDRLKVHGESSSVPLSYRRVISYGGDRTVCPALGD